MELELEDLKVTELLPEIEPLPEALFGGPDLLQDDEYSLEWLGDRLMPADVPFVQMALLDRLRNRPYHTVQLQGPIDTRRLASDHQDKLYRTEVYVTNDGKTAIKRPPDKL